MSIRTLENEQTGDWLNIYAKNLTIKEELKVADISVDNLDVSGIIKTPKIWNEFKSISFENAPLLNISSISNVSQGDIIFEDQIMIMRRTANNITVPITIYKYLSPAVYNFNSLAFQQFTQPSTNLDVYGTLSVPSVFNKWVELKFEGTLTAPNVNGGFNFYLYANNVLIITINIPTSVAFAGVPYKLTINFAGRQTIGREIFWSFERLGVATLGSVVVVNNLDSTILNLFRVDVAAQFALPLGNLIIRSNAQFLTLT